MNDEVFLLRLPLVLADTIRNIIDDERITQDNLSDTIHTAKRDIGKGMHDLYGVKDSPYLSTVWGLDVGEGGGSAVPPKVSTSATEGFIDSIYPGFRERIETELKLSSKVNRGGKDHSAIAYRKISGDDHYGFRIGQKEYHATMVSLPTNVEAHKTSNDIHTIAIGRVEKILIVHPILTSEPRPTLPQEGNFDVRGKWMHGVTRPMHRVLTDRYEATSSRAARVRMGISLSDVYQAEDDLLEFRTILQTKSATNKVKTFIREEIVDMPAWMEHLPKSKRTYSVGFVGEDKRGGGDGFRKGKIDLMRQAKANKEEIEAKLRNRNAEAEKWRQRFFMPN